MSDTDQAPLPDGVSLALTGAAVFDGGQLLQDHSVLLDTGQIVAVLPDADVDAGITKLWLDGGYLSPGFVDLQVNGGGGLMFNNSPTLDTLVTMADAHAALGVAAFLPTLITDTPAVTSAAIRAVMQAVECNVSGVVGLHLEGPHLSVDKKGAHKASLIRKMTPDDLALLLRAAEELPILKVTVSPENVSDKQIKKLSEAGVLVSIGHTSSSFEQCISACNAGARCVTHLYNAMTQLESRAAGAVGAALVTGELSAGLIADGIHVDFASIRIALAAKKAPGRIFLVSDSMATGGSDITSFMLNDREIRRCEESVEPAKSRNRLTLVDGTLAGADLDMARAVSNMHFEVGLPVASALAMATSIPAVVAGIDNLRGLGSIRTGTAANLIHLDDTLNLQRVWKGGQPLVMQNE